MRATHWEWVDNEGSMLPLLWLGVRGVALCVFDVAYQWDAVCACGGVGSGNCVCGKLAVV